MTTLLTRGLLKAEQYGLSAWAHRQRLVERGTRLHAPILLLKARRPLPGQLSLFAESPPEPDKPRIEVTKQGVLAIIRKPTGGGWEPIPRGKHGGFRRRTGQGYDYWYPHEGIRATPLIGDVEYSNKPALVLNPVESEQTKADEDEKYQTTGYVFGSRAELWQLRNAGTLEMDPSVAYKMVTKPNILGGAVSPELFLPERDAGTEPAAAYLKFQLLQGIQTRPPDSPKHRESFSEGIMMVQQALAHCRTVDEVRDVMVGWADQMQGLAPKEVLTMDEVRARGWESMFEEGPKYHHTGDFNYDEYLKWKGSPEVRAHSDARFKANAEILDYYGGYCDTRKLADGRVAFMGRVQESAADAWLDTFEALGPRFMAVCGYKIEYPYRKNRRGAVAMGHNPDERRVKRVSESKVYSGTRATALDLENSPSWEWAEPKSKAKNKRTGSNSEREDDKYHTILAQARMGEARRKGDQVPGNSGITAQGVKDSLGLNEVEYGHWATGGERQWHTEAVHGALHDLATTLGIDPKQIGQNGRLSIGIGSRGHGTFSAHYEPTTKVINLTKMSGKGSLAHEWGHFLDHMIGVVANPEKGKVPFHSDTATDGKDAGSIPQRIHQALRETMRGIMYQDVDHAEAKAELNRRLEAAKLSYYQASRDTKEERRKAYNALAKEHNRMARSGDFGVDTEFHTAAKAMGDYWSRPHEMFARSFEAYISDKMAEQGRENTYLVAGANHAKNYPGYYPGGDHRNRVNAAMDTLMATLRGDDHFSKAMGWTQDFNAGASRSESCMKKSGSGVEP